MKLELYPQYQLYKFTLLLNYSKENFINVKTGSRPINGTIINRAYYSAYSYAYLWLEDQHNFKPKQKWEYEINREEYVSEHRQVRDFLKKKRCTMYIKVYLNYMNYAKKRIITYLFH